MASAVGNLGNCREIDGSSHFLSLEKLPDPRGAACLLFCILTCSLLFQQRPNRAASELRLCMEKKRRKRCRSRLKAELAPRRPRHGLFYSAPTIPRPVLMEELFSVAFPEVLQFYCIIMGLIMLFPSAVNGI